MKKLSHILVFVIAFTIGMEPTAGEDHLHDIEPPDPTAPYATLGFCGFSSISLEDLKRLAASDEDLAPTLEAIKTLRSKDGVIVTGVLSGSAAELSGLKPFDVINSVNGTRVTTPEEAALEFARVTPPAEVECRVQRSGQRGQRTFWKSNVVDISTTSYLTFCVLATTADRDDVEKTTLLSHSDQPSRWFNSYVDLEAVQIGNDPPVLRLTFNYSSDDWLFLESVKLVTDNSVLEFNCKSPIRDNDIIRGTHRLFERESFVLSDDQNEQLRSIVGGRQTGVIRFAGRTYRKDVAFGSAALERMRVVFDRWAIVAGKPLITQLVQPKELAPDKTLENAPQAPSSPRLFRDKSGKFSVMATLLSKTSETITLKKTTGEEITIPISALSDADKDWISRSKP